MLIYENTSSMSDQRQVEKPVSSAKELRCGDHVYWPIQVLPRPLNHHAIVVAFIGDNRDNNVKLIHVTQTDNEKDEYEVREEMADLGDYIRRKELYRYDYDPQQAYEPDEVLKRARSKLGKFEYSPLTNNSEHFVRSCKYKTEELSKVTKEKSAPEIGLTVISSAKQLGCGDHVSWPTETMAGLFSHHAIVIAWKGDEKIKVIHVVQTCNKEYGVCEQEFSVRDYIEKKQLYRYDYNPQQVYEPAEVIERAKRKLGEFKYSLFQNNCEHFVRWCKYNVKESQQVEKVEQAAGSATSGLCQLI